MAAGASATEKQIDEFLNTVPWRTLTEIQKGFQGGLLMTPVGITCTLLAANPMFPEEHTAKRFKKGDVCTCLCMDLDCNPFFVDFTDPSVLARLTVQPGCAFNLFPCRCSYFLAVHNLKGHGG